MTQTHTHTHQERSRKGLVLVWLGILTCPCHWPLIVLAVLGGTAAGGLVQGNFGWVIAGSAVLSAGLIAGGYWLLRRRSADALSCPTCARAGPDTADDGSGQWQAQAWDEPPVRPGAATTAPHPSGARDEQVPSAGR